MKAQLFHWIEINRKALASNLRQFRQQIGPDRLLLAMVKANAYGHGMLEVADIALDTGADWLGVHSLEEAAELRENEFDCPILVSGYVPLQDLSTAVKLDLRLTVYNPETISRLADISSGWDQQVRLHVKLETGTFRQGVAPDQLPALLEQIKSCPQLILEGISSHFANIEDTTDHTYAQFQLSNFHQFVQQAEAVVGTIPLKHFSCSAATMLFPETYFNLVRIGIGMYGLWPSKETYLSCLLQQRQPPALKPVLSWRARIAQLKEVPKGARVGYGGTYKTGRDSRLAVIPVGYYDGYPRSLSNLSYVLIKGERAPLRGRVAMNFIVADVTDIQDVGLEDEVVLIGEEAEDRITADDLAAWDSTINYEIVTRINADIPRIVV